MRTVSITFTAGQTIGLDLVGTYFHLLTSTSPIDIEFEQNLAVFAKAQQMDAGFFSQPDGGFTALNFTSAAAQTIKVAVGSGFGGFNRTTGAVSIIGNQGAFTQSQATVTNANQVLIAANANRQYLLIQNNDTTAVLRVKVDGNAATATAGFRIPPGQSQEFNDYMPTAAINCMMETAGSGAGNVEFTWA